jgi:hypothetical protein
MSLSAPNEQLKNVASKFYKWSGDSGCFNYYDKDTKTSIDVPISEKTPFTFIILDTLSTIKGYSDSESCGFWSNEVKNTKTEPLIVRTKSGIQAAGLYADIKDGIKAKGAKYCQSTYVAMKSKDGLEVVNLQLQGVALKAMGDFAKANKVMGMAVQVKSCTEGKKGKTVFQVPVFNLLKLSEKTLAEATALDVILQDYLKAFFAKNAENQAANPVAMAQASPAAEQPKVAPTGKFEGHPDPNEPAPFDPEDDEMPF